MSEETNWVDDYEEFAITSGPELLGLIQNESELCEVIHRCGWNQAKARKDQEIQRLQSLIDEHNRGMDAECESEYNRKLRGCEGYTGRGKRCPECPKDHKIED